MLYNGGGEAALLEKVTVKLRNSVPGKEQVPEPGCQVRETGDKERSLRRGVKKALKLCAAVACGK